MFFCPELLKKRGGKFFPVWVAATQHGNTLKKYLPVRKIKVVDIPAIVRDIINIVMNQYPMHLPRPLSSPAGRFSLYLSSKLMYGACIVLKQQATLLFCDIHLVFKNLNELNWCEEQNALVRKVAKEKKKRISKPRHEHGHFLDTFSEFPCDIADISDIYLISDDNDMPLNFNNSVPSHSITMKEVVPFQQSLNEDLRFGDEDNPLMLQFLDSEIDFTENLSGRGHEVYQGPNDQHPSHDTIPTVEPPPITVADPKLSHDGILIVEPTPTTEVYQGPNDQHPSHDTIPTVEPPPITVADPKLSHDRILIVEPTPTTEVYQGPNDQHPSHDTIPTVEQPPITVADPKLSHDGILIVEPTPITDAVSPCRTPPIELQSSTGPVCQSTPSTVAPQCPTVIVTQSMPSPVGLQSTTKTIPVPVLHASPPLAADQYQLWGSPLPIEIGVQGVARQDVDVLQLSDISDDLPVKPVKRRGKKSKRPLMDPVVCIPSSEMVKRMSNNGAHTLQKTSPFTDLKREKSCNLDAFKQPGRGIHLSTSLRAMFDRALVTMPKPTERPLLPSPAAPVHRVEQAERISEERHLGDGDGQVDVLHTEDTVPQDNTRVEHLSEVQHFGDRDGPEDGFNLEDTVAQEKTEDQPVSELMPLDTRDCQDTAVQFQLAIDADENVIPGQHGGTDISATFTAVVPTLGEDVRSSSPKRRKVDKTQVSLSKTQKKKHPDSERDSETAITTKKPRIEEVPVHILKNGAPSEIQASSGEALIDQVLGSSEHSVLEQQDTGGDLLGTPERSGQLRREGPMSEGIPPLTPLTPIESKINQLPPEQDSISFFDLFPPSSTKKRSATRYFLELLQLHKSKEVILKQERDGDTFGPLEIAFKKQNED